MNEKELSNNMQQDFKEVINMQHQDQTVKQENSAAKKFPMEDNESYRMFGLTKSYGKETVVDAVYQRVFDNEMSLETINSYH
jgi:hypothetical protein